MICYNCNEIITGDVFYGDDGLEPYCENCISLADEYYNNDDTIDTDNFYIGSDSMEDIKKCLNCNKPECVNCLRFINKC